jgi:hypothetical protein
MSSPALTAWVVTERAARIATSKSALIAASARKSSLASGEHGAAARQVGAREARPGERVARAVRPVDHGGPLDVAAGQRQRGDVRARNDDDVVAGIDRAGRDRAVARNAVS